MTKSSSGWLTNTNCRNYKQLFFTYPILKWSKRVSGSQLHKLHLFSNHIWRVLPTEPYQLQKLHTDFFTISCRSCTPFWITISSVKSASLPNYTNYIWFRMRQSGLGTLTNTYYRNYKQIFLHILFWKGLRESVAANYTDYTSFWITSEGSRQPNWPTTETTHWFFSLYPVLKRLR